MNGEEKCRAGKVLNQQCHRDEVHIGNAVLEPCCYEAGNGRDDGQDLIGGGSTAVGKPDCQADQHVAEDSEHDRLEETQAGLGFTNGQDISPHRAGAESIFGAEANMIAAIASEPTRLPDEDDPPVAQE